MSETRPPPCVAMLLRLVPQSALDNPFQVPTDDNILLLLPEKRLPRYRQVLGIVRVVLGVVVLAKLLAMMGPGLQFLLLLGDMTVGSMGFVLALLLATWAHARDLRTKFHLDQLLLIPCGPGLLAQALVVRPLGDILRLLLIYYIFSMLLFCINALSVVFFYFMEVQDALGVILAAFFVLMMQGPWIVIILWVLLDTALRAVRTEFTDDASRLTQLFLTILTNGFIFGGLFVVSIIAAIFVIFMALEGPVVVLLVLMVATLGILWAVAALLMRLADSSFTRATHLFEELQEMWLQ